MAKLNSPISFTGRLGNISAYQITGLEGTFVRMPGGPSKEQYDNNEKQRNTGSEFGGRATSTKYLRRALSRMERMGDSYFTGQLNALVTHIQTLDRVSRYGKRCIYFSEHGKLLEGFNLNKKNTFDSVVRNPLLFEIQKDSLSASVSFPALIPGINFFAPPGNYPAYSFVACIGVVPDIVFHKDEFKPMGEARADIVESDWYSALGGSPAVTIYPSLEKLFTDASACPAIYIDVVCRRSFRYYRIQQ